VNEQWKVGLTGRSAPIKGRRGSAAQAKTRAAAGHGGRSPSGGRGQILFDRNPPVRFDNVMVVTGIKKSPVRGMHSQPDNYS